MIPQPPDEDIDWNALARFFAEEATEAEEIALREWIAAEPGRKELVAQLREIWRRTGHSGQSWDAHAALSEIRSKAAASARALPHRVFTIPVQERRRSRPALAAAAILTVGLIGWWALRPEPGAPVQMAEVVTGKGERAMLRLDDGTHVVLGVDSRLRYPQSDRAQSRDVYLSGVALFEVTHDPKRPFRVHTVHGVAEDLGTRFQVRAYGGDSSTEVVVQEGEVALGRTTPTVLKAGDLGRLESSGAVQVERGVDVARHVAWTDGRLIFDDTPVRDVLAEIARWYDLEITVASEALAAQPITASFRDEPVAEVLTFIASAVNARYDRAGRVVTFRPN